MGPKEKIRVKIDVGKGNDYADDIALAGVREAMLEADGILVDLLSTPGQGEVYKRGNVEHRASKPGQPPAPDTGELRRNRGKEVFARAGGATAVLSLNQEYAEALEVGTEHIEPRKSIGLIPTRYLGRLVNAFVQGTRRFRT